MPYVDVKCGCEEPCQDWLDTNSLKGSSGVATPCRVWRSKVSQIPDLEPVPAVGLRRLLQLTAVDKALRAFNRHGERSYQFQKSRRSRWLRAFAAAGEFVPAVNI